MEAAREELGALQVAKPNWRPLLPLGAVQVQNHKNDSVAFAPIHIVGMVFYDPYLALHGVASMVWTVEEVANN
ncbi:hypothetical protein DSECCO2_634940 [anaerobic digester metagenome]